MKSGAQIYIYTAVTLIQWKMEPFEDVFPIENGDIPAGYVSLPEGIYIYVRVPVVTLIIDPIVAFWVMDLQSRSSNLELEMASCDLACCNFLWAGCMGTLAWNTCMLQELLFERSRRKICISPSREK